MNRSTLGISLETPVMRDLFSFIRDEIEKTDEHRAFALTVDVLYNGLSLSALLDQKRKWTGQVYPALTFRQAAGLVTPAASAPAAPVPISVATAPAAQEQAAKVEAKAPPAAEPGVVAKPGDNAGVTSEEDDENEAALAPEPLTGGVAGGGDNGPDDAPAAPSAGVKPATTPAKPAPTAEPPKAAEEKQPEKAVIPAKTSANPPSSPAPGGIDSGPMDLDTAPVTKPAPSAVKAGSAPSRAQGSSPRPPAEQKPSSRAFPSHYPESFKTMLSSFSLVHVKKFEAMMVENAYMAEGGDAWSIPAESTIFIYFQRNPVGTETNIRLKIGAPAKSATPAMAA